MVALCSSENVVKIFHPLAQELDSFLHLQVTRHTNLKKNQQNKTKKTRRQHPDGLFDLTVPPRKGQRGAHAGERSALPSSLWWGGGR